MTATIKAAATLDEAELGHVVAALAALKTGDIGSGSDAHQALTTKLAHALRAVRPDEYELLVSAGDLAALPPERAKGLSMKTHAVNLIRRGGDSLQTAGDTGTAYALHELANNLILLMDRTVTIEDWLKIYSGDGAAALDLSKHLPVPGDEADDDQDVLDREDLDRRERETWGGAS